MKRIGIVAPSSVIPQIELRMGVERIRQDGFEVDVHPQCRKKYLFFAGTDQERAQAFFDYATSPEHSVLWCARGGHGAIRLLPILDRMSEDLVRSAHGNPDRGNLGQGQSGRGTPIQSIIPKKLLVGYSDATALMEYVRQKWGWSTLHAPMPSLRKYSILPDHDLGVLSAWIKKMPAEARWVKKRLDFWTTPPLAEINAPLVGGNLTVWNCLLGTNYEARAKGCILFFEDVDENLYRIDRMLHHLALTQSIQGVRAVVLGSFLNCKDYCPSVLKSMPPAKARKRAIESPKPGELKPLRKVFKEAKALRQIFTEWGERLKIPVAYGLPVGHGPDFAPMPLGLSAEYSLSRDGYLKLRQWDWLNAP